MLLAELNLPKSLTFLRNFYKGVTISHFSSKIIIGQFFSGHTGCGTVSRAIAYNIRGHGYE